MSTNYGMFHLIVHDPFAGYVMGDRIEDPETVEAVMRSENSGCVIRIKALQPPVNMRLKAGIKY